VPTGLRDVSFAPSDTTDTTATAAVERAYRAKYGRYAASYLDPMLTDRATAATLRLLPR
jgi:hypothetical protein